MSANEILLRLDTLRFRHESDDDRAFRYRLFRDSRSDEWERLPLDATLRAQLMRLQFEAQTISYRAQFPDARFDIVELADEPIGRIVVDRPGTLLRLVDLALVPQYRNRGIGTAILAALIDEAQAVQLPVRLAVATGNEAALRLYLRLGFVPIATTEMDVESWRAGHRGRRANDGGRDRTALVAGVVPGLALPAQDGALADILADLPAPGAAIGAETERLNRLALANVSERQYAEAIRHLQRVLSLNPDSVATHHNLGVTLALAKRVAEAEVHYRKAIALNPKWVPAWMNLAALLSQRYEFDAAIACYDKVTALEPGNVASLNNAALLLRRSGQFEAARARFARALELAPADPRTRFNHAIIEDNAASRREAIDTCRQCLEQDPHSASLLSNLAICHQMVGEFDEAFGLFERAIAADWEFHEAWFNRSLLRLSLGDFAAGWAEYEHRQAAAMPARKTSISVIEIRGRGRRSTARRSSSIPSRATATRSSSCAMCRRSLRAAAASFCGSSASSFAWRRACRET